MRLFEQNPKFNRNKSIRSLEDCPSNEFGTRANLEFHIIKDIPLN